MSSTSSRVSLSSALATTLALGSLGCVGQNYSLGWTSGIVSLVVLVCWIVAIVQIIQSSQGGTSKLIWILVVLFLPVIGTILWFIIGKR